MKISIIINIFCIYNIVFLGINRWFFYQNCIYILSDHFLQYHKLHLWNKKKIIFSVQYQLFLVWRRKNCLIFDDRAKILLYFAPYHTFIFLLVIFIFSRFISWYVWSFGPISTMKWIFVFTIILAIFQCLQHSRRRRKKIEMRILKNDLWIWHKFETWLKKLKFSSFDSLQVGFVQVQSNFWRKLKRRISSKYLMNMAKVTILGIFPKTYYYPICMWPENMVNVRKRKIKHCKW